MRRTDCLGIHVPGCYSCVSKLLVRVGQTNLNFLDYRTWDDEPDNRVSTAAHRRGNEWSTESGWSLILSDVPGVVHGQAELSDSVQPS